MRLLDRLMLSMTLFALAGELATGSKWLAVVQLASAGLYFAAPDQRSRQGEGS